MSPGFFGNPVLNDLAGFGSPASVAAAVLRQHESAVGAPGSSLAVEVQRVLVALLRHRQVALECKCRGGVGGDLPQALDVAGRFLGLADLQRRGRRKRQNRRRPRITLERLIQHGESARDVATDNLGVREVAGVANSPGFEPYGFRETGRRAWHILGAQKHQPLHVGHRPARRVCCHGRIGHGFRLRRVVVGQVELRKAELRLDRLGVGIARLEQVFLGRLRVLARAGYDGKPQHRLHALRIVLQRTLQVPLGFCRLAGAEVESCQD